MPTLEQLGFVTTPSGVLIVIDTGCLNLWSHDRTPALPESVLRTEDATKRANSFVDLRIVGSDAVSVGQQLDMSWHPLYVYDQPPDHPDLQAKLDTLVRANGLEARFEVMPHRIPHRTRVELALQNGKGAGEIQYHGLWAVAVSDVPTSHPIPVLAERSEAYDDRWRRVIIRCRAHTRAARSERVGSVAVDYARLLIADVDALGHWHHEESLDGKADYAFWGRDAEIVASVVRAARLESGEFGWRDVSEEFAQERGIAVERYRDEHALKLAGDYRPHSDHWRVMTPTRKSPTESATVELEGVSICNFMTTWGDGVFEVYRDLGDSGELLQIRVELDNNNSMR